jgi:hypothetical protein
MRFWVQHPENCSGGKTADGRCLGLVGEREWTLSLKLSEPNSLWEEVKGWGENCLPLSKSVDISLLNFPQKCHGYIMKKYIVSSKPPVFVCA